MPIERVWSAGLASPFDAVEWTVSPVVLKSEKTGEITYRDDAVEHPRDWSQNAVDMCASKYFRRADIPGIGGEHSVKQLAKRVAACLRKHGEAKGYFSDSDAAQVFEDEIIVGFITQRIGFNSPVWFNYGLHSEYGLVGSGRERYVWNAEKNDVEEIHGELVRPSGAACYISAVSDSLFTDDIDGMAELLLTEQRIFLTGAGDGLNVSPIRGRGEPISGGGRSAGLISYLRVRDANAGYIKSGGKTRRSATILCIDMDHPDIEEFIDWKTQEEKKAAVLISAGYEGGLEGDAYSTVSGQNGNNSVRISDVFLKCVDSGSDWHLLSRVPFEKWPEAAHTHLVKSTTCSQGALWLDENGDPRAVVKKGEDIRRKIVKTVKASDLWNKVCLSAWETGCPGVQFDDIMNAWNTTPKYGRINATNPCLAGETKIKTSSGTIRMDDWAASKERREVWVNNLGWKWATAFQTKVEKTVKLSFSNGKTLTCTLDHRLLCSDGSETQACAAVGKTLEGLGDEKGRFVDVAEISDTQAVYDFSIEGNLEDNERWALAEGVYVHNCSEVCLPDWSVCNLGTINLIKFFADVKNPKWSEFEHACKLMTQALDLVVEISSYPTRQHARGCAMTRAIGLNHGNIGAVLMANGIAYDSDEGRTWMSIITSTMTLHAARQSMELAQLLGHYPVFDYEDHQRVFSMHADHIASVMSKPYAKKHFESQKLVEAWSSLAQSNKLKKHGVRNAALTTLNPQGTIGIVLDQDTLGCEPDYSLIKHKKLVGGGSMVQTNHSIAPGLMRLGYNPSVVQKIIAYVHRFGTVEGCCHIKSDDMVVFETAAHPDNTADLDGLTLSKKDIDLIRHTVSKAKSKDEVFEALPKRLRVLLADRIKVFTRAISYDGHTKALAAIQPHISMSASKTVNMANDVSVEDVARVYRQCHKMGVKCVAIYRDQSKKAQPLSAGKRDEKTPVGKTQDWTPTDWPATLRTPPRYTPNCDLFHFTIRDPNEPGSVFVNTALYPDSPDLMAIFVNIGRQGDTVNGLVHSLARIISTALQYGVPPEELGKNLKDMCFPPSGFLGNSSAFGIYRAKSISDLIGRLLIELPRFYKSDRDEEIMYPPTESQMTLISKDAQDAYAKGVEIRPDNAKMYGYTGKQCNNCGSWRTVGDAKCQVCQDCSGSNGPCLG